MIVIFFLVHIKANKRLCHHFETRRSGWRCYGSAWEPHRSLHQRRGWFGKMKKTSEHHFHQPPTQFCNLLVIVHQSIFCHGFSSTNSSRTAAWFTCVTWTSTGKILARLTHLESWNFEPWSPLLWRNAKTYLCQHSIRGAVTFFSSPGYQYACTSTRVCLLIEAGPWVELIQIHSGE